MTGVQTCALPIFARVELIGPHTAALGRALFAQLGRPGNRALYALANLPRTYARADIEAVCARLHEAQCVSYAAVRGALERRALEPPVAAPPLTQSGPGIRALSEYQTFFDQHAAQPSSGDTP